MDSEYIDGLKLKEMFLAAAQSLEANKQVINALNVFPVPDGDTGTNMSLTMMVAIREIQDMEDNTVAKVVDAASKGALKGARGNSGVILSQLFRGFARALQEVDRISTRDCANALQEASRTAYKAVMKPVEGTMLTVARVAGEEAIKLSRRCKSFIEFADAVVEVAKETLDKTPDMLPPLKEAGVVDSGGMGILYILIGAVEALKGTFDPESLPAIERAKIAVEPDTQIEADIKYGYCTEFLVKNLISYINDKDMNRLKSQLGNLGDSIVVVGDDDLIKVHVHTDMPGKALQIGLRFGELSGIKIDNMREQHRHVIEHNSKDMGIVTVAMGEGINSIFKDLGADYVIEGGQTMNPSIDDILKAVDKVNAKTVFVLPNNSNIVLSANQARDISDKNIVVIPSKSIPQGLSAILAFNPEEDVESNIMQIQEAMQNVESGQVTYAIRDSEYNGIAIKKDDIIGLVNGDIVVAGQDVGETTTKLLGKMLEEERDIVTILYGNETDEGDAKEIEEYLEENYPDMDVEIHPGGQPLYYYIISVE